MRRLGLLLVLLALTVPTAGAATGEVALSLPDEFRFGEATLAIGHLDPGEPELSDVHAVGVHTFDVPDGTLFVCRSEGGRSDEVPPVPAVQERCRDEDTYEDPELAFGERTWLVFGGNLTLSDPPNASTTMLYGASNGSSLHLASVTAGTLDAELDRQLVFRPQSGASEVAVTGEDDRRTYNGTEWLFYLEASGTATLGSRAVHAEVPTPVDLTLTEAGTANVRDALEARALLDLQAAVVSPEAREPVENVTRLAGDQTRLPPLVDGSLLGHLNGTIGDRGLDPDEPSLVGLEQLEGTVDEPSATADRVNLTGNASVQFVKTDAGLASGLGDPSGVPWLAVVVLGIGAGLSLALGPSPVERSIRHRAFAAAAFAIALLVWDAVFASALGHSALTAAAGQAELGVVFSLGAFEAVAFALAWLLLAFPTRLAGERWLVDRLACWTSPVATGLLTIYAVLDPGAVVSIGRLVAQI